MTKWSYIEHPLISLGDNEQWYLVGSPERAIGYVRNEEDAKLIAAAPEMYEVIKVLLEEPPLIGPDYALMDATYKAQKLVARIDGKEVEHD